MSMNMNVYNENLGSRILELLKVPVGQRCLELGLIFDRCSLKELQEIFPILISSIFGISGNGMGWGLRTIAKENCPDAFNILYNFFSPLGPMFRLCYRLLSDAIKFDFSIELLPHKLTEMLQSGHYSMFYADLLNVDPFHRCITSLSLNAFDYFILNFIIHGTYSLHKMYPAALQVHNDRIKTVYFYLIADYLCTFLPASPDALVMPTNICGTVKAPQPMPVQQLQPTRSPKYLRLSPISHYTAAAAASSSTSSTIRTPDSPRAHCWRSESLMYFSLDTWLRYDVDVSMELPSSEFIRVVRILVKQLHAFGNSADLDQTSMAVLRKLAQPMIKARIYPFLKKIIARWPLDSSLTVVLELWLSYLQPWRYTFERHLDPTNHDILITNRYEAFIAENLGIYTQIFVQILPRFERLDFTSFRNVVMLHRLIKVFNQSNLPQILIECEHRYSNSPFPQITNSQQSPIRNSSYYKQRADATGEWNSFRNTSGEHFFPDTVEGYIPMFGQEIKCEINLLIKTICVAKMYLQHEVSRIDQELLKGLRGMNFIKSYLLSLLNNLTPEELKLQEMKKIPDLLDIALESICNMFNMDIPDITYEHPSFDAIDLMTYNQQIDFTLGEDSDYFDILKIQPAQMKNNIANIKASIDPALLPIQSHESTFLVRILHQFSSKLNETFYNEIQAAWNRMDIWGKLSRQILYPPITVQWFDKSKGISELCEEQLKPRICLRAFGSYRVIFLIMLWIIIGKLFWEFSVMFSVSILIMISFFILFILTLLYN